MATRFNKYKTSFDQGFGAFSYLGEHPKTTRDERFSVIDGFYLK